MPPPLDPTEPRGDAGHEPEPLEFPSTVLGALRPVELAHDDEVRAAANKALMVKRLQLLVNFIGAGTPIADGGGLRPGDAKALVTILRTDVIDPASNPHSAATKSSDELIAVDLTYRIALAAELLIINGDMVVPLPATHVAVDDSLLVCQHAFMGLITGVGSAQHHARHHPAGAYWFAWLLDQLMSDVLIELYNATAPIVIEDFVEDAMSAIEYDYDLDYAPGKIEVFVATISTCIHRALGHLVDLAMVVIYDEVVTRSAGTIERGGPGAALTPLGLWVIQHRLREVMDAPTIGALRNVSASELLRQASDKPEKVARAEITNWVRHRTAAADELCDAMINGDESTVGLAFRTLLAIGPSAADAIAHLEAHEHLAPYVTLWRVDAQVAEHDAMDCSHNPTAYVALLHAAIATWGPVAAAATWAVPAAGRSGITAMTEQLWRLDDPRTEVVLAAISEHHDNETVAKAARKALFKHRSRL
jgi:hypothetical protein